MKPTMTLAKLQAYLDTLDDGLLRQGMHDEGREFCALEFESQVRGREWSDEAITLPDIRPLNDAFGKNDKARTAAILPLMVALWDWSRWSSSRRRAWITIVIIETVRRIISQLPGLSKDVRRSCTRVKTLRQAVSAASQAEDTVAAATCAADAARDAAYAAKESGGDVDYAAGHAADAADGAAGAASFRGVNMARSFAVLEKACAIWIKAAKKTGKSHAR